MPDSPPSNLGYSIPKFEGFLVETISAPSSKEFLSGEWHNPTYAKNSKKQTPQLRSDFAVKRSDSASTRVESLFSEDCFE